MESKTFHVPAIGCDGCVRTITSEVSQIEGVADVQGDVQTRMVTVRWEAPATWDQISQRLWAIEYAPDLVVGP
jgi:copper chaperone CopZ